MKSRNSGAVPAGAVQKLHDEPSATKAHIRKVQVHPHKEVAAPVASASTPDKAAADAKTGSSTFKEARRREQPCPTPFPSPAAGEPAAHTLVQSLGEDRAGTHSIPHTLKPAQGEDQAATCCVSSVEEGRWEVVAAAAVGKGRRRGGGGSGGSYCQSGQQKAAAAAVEPPITLGGGGCTADVQRGRNQGMSPAPQEAAWQLPSQSPPGPAAALRRAPPPAEELPRSDQSQRPVLADPIAATATPPLQPPPLQGPWAVQAGRRKQQSTEEQSAVALQKPEASRHQSTEEQSAVALQPEQPTPRGSASPCTGATPAPPASITAAAPPTSSPPAGSSAADPLPPAPSSHGAASKPELGKGCCGPADNVAPFFSAQDAGALSLRASSPPLAPPPWGDWPAAALEAVESACPGATDLDVMPQVREKCEVIVCERLSWRVGRVLTMRQREASSGYYTLARCSAIPLPIPFASALPLAGVRTYTHTCDLLHSHTHCPIPAHGTRWV